MKEVKSGFQIAYLIVGVLTVLEFLFVRGMFTWLMAVAAVVFTGAGNALLAARDRDWMGMLLYLLCTAALCMGYLVLA